METGKCMGSVTFSGPLSFLSFVVRWIEHWQNPKCAAKLPLFICLMDCLGLLDCRYSWFSSVPSHVLQQMSLLWKKTGAQFLKCSFYFLSGDEQWRDSWAWKDPVYLLLQTLLFWRNKVGQRPCQGQAASSVPQETRGIPGPLLILSCLSVGQDDTKWQRVKGWETCICNACPLIAAASLINETDALSQDRFSLGRGGPIAADITNYHENKTQFSGRSQSVWPSNSFLLRRVVRPRLCVKWDRVTPGTAVVLEVGLSLNQKNKLQCGVPISFHFSTFLFALAVICGILIFAWAVAWEMVQRGWENGCSAQGLMA